MTTSLTHKAIAWTMLSLSVVTAQVRAAGTPSFEREIRPILSRYCFKCHGPDEGQRQSGLRLDVRDAATKLADSGKAAIVPSKPDNSELIRRIHLPDGSEEKMPPASTKLELTAEQRDILKRWVASGAEYRPHWAFVAPKRPALPKVRDASWPRNGIDQFVLARLEAEGHKPSPQADRHTLARRVFLDLIGVPPTPAEVDEFVNDPSLDAYEQLVDRLLASPAYGERWARRWLDLARYADTNGYEKDRTRNVWPYRDWVINAINADQPFDQFTIDQLAGDMRPHANIQQRIATGFHRNTMLNEEGGIDPLEFRFHAMTDRVATTGSVWLGLTIGCAQCHTHKYDPITHTDYYRFFGLLNNAEEPELDIPVPELVAKQTEIDRRVAELEADLPNRFPLPDEFSWTPLKPIAVKSANGATAEVQSDASVLLSGTTPETDSYEIQLDSDLRDVAAIRLEALIDDKLPSKGPGRTPHGNFVLSEITASIALRDTPNDAQSLKFAHASADFSQDQFAVAQAIDGNTKTGGWAIHGPGTWNVNRTATFVLAQPAGFADKPARWTIKLEQQHGMKHTLGKFRISLGRRNSASGSPDEQRRKHFDQKYAAWLAETQKSLIHWETPQIVAATSNLPLLTVEGNGIVFVSGDMSKSDLYELTLKSSLKEIVALRLEALPDDRLPKHGPGRVYYEGPFGDFFLSDIALTVADAPRRFARATQTFAAGNSNAMAAVDDNKQTGWSINGGQGKPHTAVFQLAEPLKNDGPLHLRMLFERYYAPGLGKFRISVTNDPRAVEAPILPADVESELSGKALAAGAPNRSKPAASAVPLTEHAALVKQFCATAPELASTRQEIESLRTQRPALPTALVLQERPANNPRPTHRHHRGEYLQPKELVAAGSLSALPPLLANSAADRLALANWLVSPSNPLTARVTVNRHWAALFGRGLVRTQEDFGFQGALPTHPELLDWLAVEFSARRGSPDPAAGPTEGLPNVSPASNSGRPSVPTNGGVGRPAPSAWSLKRLHRLIVTSATYQQSSRVTPELLRRDAQNELLARGPRFRVEAESVRDSLLTISGLLGRKLGGPSVFPPQPANITTEGTYGQLAWKVSEGLDRHRRSLYTFAKRTAPFAMFTTFDAPSGEACVVRREVSNTPLQALTLLNDSVFTEASQALGRQFAALPSSDDARLAELFRRCLTRPPTDAEIALLSRFLKTQRERLATKELDAATLAGPGEGDASERAAWSLVARALLNLDEAVTKD